MAKNGEIVDLGDLDPLTLKLWNFELLVIIYRMLTPDINFFMNSQVSCSFTITSFSGTDLLISPVTISVALIINVTL